MENRRRSSSWVIVLAMGFHSSPLTESLVSGVIVWHIIQLFCELLFQLFTNDTLTGYFFFSLNCSFQGRVELGLCFTVSRPIALSHGIICFLHCLISISQCGS